MGSVAHTDVISAKLLHASADTPTRLKGGHGAKPCFRFSSSGRHLRWQTSPRGPILVLATRCNFCTLDAEGNITDRRAGRIPTEQSAPLAKKLRQVEIPGVEVFVEPVKEHRFVVVFRGPGLGGNVADTDPQKTGVPPLDPVADDDASQKTVEVARQFVQQAVKLLADQPAANGLTMRGFSNKPAIPGYEEVYGLKAAAIAVYPMYKGLAQLAGMEIVGQPGSLSEEVDVLAEVWNDYDFFFLHFKYTDSRGEDGDFDAKVKVIEEFDSIIPRVVELNPTVLIVTADHSTPARDVSPARSTAAVSGESRSSATPAAASSGLRW